MKKLITFVLLVGLSLLGASPVRADDTNFSSVEIDTAGSPGQTNSTTVFRINNLAGTAIFTVTGGGVITLAGALTTTAAMTVTSITASGDVQGEEVIGTQYVRIPYFAKNLRPGSDAPKGSAILIYGVNAADCSANPGANTVLLLCVADDHDWRVV